MFIFFCFYAQCKVFVVPSIFFPLSRAVFKRELLHTAKMQLPRKRSHKEGLKHSP